MVFIKYHERSRPSHLCVLSAGVHWRGQATSYSLGLFFIIKVVIWKHELFVSSFLSVEKAWCESLKPNSSFALKFWRHNYSVPYSVSVTQDALGIIGILWMKIRSLHKSKVVLLWMPSHPKKIFAECVFMVSTTFCYLTKLRLGIKSKRSWNIQ